MKPRNKREREVLAIANKLPGLTEAQRNYGRKLFKPTGWYYKNGEIWCSHCGHVFRELQSVLAVSLGCGGETCPECGLPLHMEHEQGRPKFKNFGKYVSYVQSYKGWMIVRTFAFRMSCEKGKGTTWEEDEIFQNWIDAAGNEVIVTKKYTRSPFHLMWYYDSEWTIGKHNASWSGYCDLFDVYGNYFYPRTSATKICKRNGWRSELVKLKLNVAELIKRLYTNPQCEWLVKTGQLNVLEYLMRKNNYTTPYEYALKIANRHGIKIKDASLWFDYLDLLHYFGKDLRSPKWVAREDYKEVHDRLVRKKAEREARKRLEEKRNKIEGAEKQYKEHMGRFIGVAFCEGDIQVNVLSSVKEFYEEGEAMHHCVFSNEYWNATRHPNSLILSATDKEGNRLETVEVDTKTWKIIQSRGVCNRRTALHEDIVKLVDKNIPRLKSCR